MTRPTPLNVLLALACASAAGPLLAQPAPMAATGTEAVSPTRAQVRMDTQEFLRTHRWDDLTDTWTLKTGVEPPTGVVSRAVVRAQRDEYMRLNRYDERSATWMPRKPAPEVHSTLTREQVRRDTLAFMRTHRWDEEASQWVARPPTKAR